MFRISRFLIFPFPVLSAAYRPGNARGGECGEIEARKRSRRKAPLWRVLLPRDEGGERREQRESSEGGKEVSSPCLYWSSSEEPRAPRLPSSTLPHPQWYSPPTMKKKERKWEIDGKKTVICWYRKMRQHKQRRFFIFHLIAMFVCLKSRTFSSLNSHRRCIDVSN